MLTSPAVAVLEMLRSDAITLFAMCPVDHARTARRSMVAELVDGAAGCARPGAKPKVRAFPGNDAAQILQTLQTLVTLPDCPPNLAAYLTGHLAALITYGARILGRGEVPCLMVGRYEVTAEPDDTHSNRPLKVMDGNGNVLQELYRGGGIG